MQKSYIKQSLCCPLKWFYGIHLVMKIDIMQNHKMNFRNRLVENLVNLQCKSFSFVFRLRLKPRKESGEERGQNQPP